MRHRSNYGPAQAYAAAGRRLIPTSWARLTSPPLRVTGEAIRRLGGGWTSRAPTADQDASERDYADAWEIFGQDCGAVSLKSPFHLAETIRTSAALAATLAQDRGVDLILDLDRAAESRVLGDEARLRAVLANLIFNALASTSEGYVAVAVRPEAGAGWRLEVQDTGEGLVPEDFAQILAASDLGAPVCARDARWRVSQDLLVQMGAALEADGAPGAGATITLRLTLPPAEPEPVSEAVSPAPSRAARVLLADDHPAHRALAQALMAGAAVQLVTVENGDQACQAFASGAFDLVLMDLHMPVMDGLSATRAIRRFEEARGAAPTLVVMLTANSAADLFEASREAGADRHMTKPLKADELCALLEEVMAASTSPRQIRAA